MNAVARAVTAATMRTIADCEFYVSSVMAGGVWIVTGNRISSDCSARPIWVTLRRRQCLPSFAPDTIGESATYTPTTRFQSRSGQTYDSTSIIYGRDAMPVIAARHCGHQEGPVGPVK
jgi:hypothetical protein